jgi:hypothetical protein
VKSSRKIHFWILFSFVIATAANAHAETVIYELDNVILDDGGTQMFGTFSWTFTPRDFENGEGVFTYLEIPFTLHDETDLNATFDIGSSIEITLEGSVHDDGIDITLSLEEPLTPTTSSLIVLEDSEDLKASKYEIGGNGFHDGSFLSGSIQVVPEPGAASSLGCAFLTLALLTRRRAH